MNLALSLSESESVFGRRFSTQGNVPLDLTQLILFILC